MVFQIIKADFNPDVRILNFNGAEKFRFDLTNQLVTMTGLSGEPTQVYHFSWWSVGDWFIRWELRKALEFHDATMHRVRMQDYRALFGREMELILTDLAELMTAAEAEGQMLQRVDSTEGGKRLHKDVRRLVQADDEDDEQEEAEG